MEDLVELGRNARGAVAFVLPTIALMLQNTIGAYAHPEWGKAIPGLLVPVATALTPGLMPLVVLAAGFGIMLGLSNRPAGFGIIIAIAAFNLTLNVPTTYWRFESGYVQGALICGVAGLIGCLSLYFAISALRDLVSSA